MVAAVSYAAKLARTGGGFRTGSTEPIMIAQIQLLGVPDAEQAPRRAILAAQAGAAGAGQHQPDALPAAAAGRWTSRCVHLPDTPTDPMLIVHLLFDTRDAMGANAVNTAAETIAPAAGATQRRPGAAAHPQQPDRPPPRLGRGDDSGRQLQHHRPSPATR